MAGSKRGGVSRGSNASVYSIAPTVLPSACAEEGALKKISKYLIDRDEVDFDQLKRDKQRDRTDNVNKAKQEEDARADALKQE